MHNHPVDILAIAGSLRRGSYNRRVLETAASNAPAGVSVTVYDDLGRVPLFDEDVERRRDGGYAGAVALAAAVARADGLLIATPEYNQSIPGVLKNAIDWLSRPLLERALKHKRVAVIGATVGPWGTRLAQAALRQTLTAAGALVLPSAALYLPQIGAQFDEDGKPTDPALGERLNEFLAAFHGWIVDGRA